MMISPNPCNTPNLRLLVRTTLAPLTADTQKHLERIATSTYACLLRNLMNRSRHERKQVRHLAAYSETLSLLSFMLSCPVTDAYDDVLGDNPQSPNDGQQERPESDRPEVVSDQPEDARLDGAFVQDPGRAEVPHRGGAGDDEVGASEQEGDCPEQAEAMHVELDAVSLGPTSAPGSS